MKDIYDQLNDINVDASQFEEEEVSAAEMDSVKTELRRKIRTPKPVRWKKMAAAASITIGLSSAALFGLSFTSFAQEIPIIGQVFKWFNDDGLYENYSEHANALSMTQEDNGISITVNEAVFDGKMLYITYDIVSETDLGETPYFKGMPAILNHDGGHMATASHDIKKVDDTHYVGITKAQIYPENRVEQGSFDFHIEGILLEPGDNVELVPGNWKFQFDLQATNNVEQLVGLASADNDVTVTVDKVVYTPMSTVLFYEELVTRELNTKWDFISVRVAVKDDLGNTYTTEHNGGMSNTDLRLYHSNTFGKLDPKATKLIVTPSVELAQRDGTDENGSYYRNEGSTAPMEEFELDEIVIEIEK